MRIWSVTSVMRLKDRMVVIVIIIIWVGVRRVICQRVLLMWRWLVWWLVVGIVMLLWVQRVILSVVVVWVEGVALFVFLIVAIRVVDVLHRVLQSFSQRAFHTHTFLDHTVGCACNRSLGV